jgi:hypothetical protein
MYCVKCGAQLGGSQRFCVGCGTPVDVAPVTAARPATTQRAATPQRAAPTQRPARQPGSRGPWVILVIAGVAIIAIVAAFVVQQRLRSAAPPSAATPQEPLPQPAAPPQPVPPQSVAPPPAAPADAGFDWTGLSREELLAARSALDAAIAREEQQRTAPAGGKPANSDNVR